MKTSDFSFICGIILLSGASSIHPMTAAVAIVVGIILIAWAKKTQDEGD